MIIKNITNVILKKETIKYLKEYRSYLVRIEREKRKYLNSKKTELLFMYLIPRTEVEVRYKGKVIEGVIVGHPKMDKDRFCLESDQLDVQIKKYSRGHELGYSDTYWAKRKYFPISAISGLPKSVKSELEELSKAYKSEPFKFEFKHASETFQKSLKETVVTKKDVDTALAKVYALKVKRFSSSPSERFDKCQQAILEGMGKDDVVSFLYSGKVVVGLTRRVPDIKNKRLFVHAPEVLGTVCGYGNGKYIDKCNFVKWIHDPELKKKLLKTLGEFSGSFQGW